MMATILTRPRPKVIRPVRYHSFVSFAALRVAVGAAVLLSVLLTQSCATQEMETTEKAAVPASNATEEQLAQQDNTFDVTVSAPERTSFESMYLQRNKMASDEQE